MKELFTMYPEWGGSAVESLFSNLRIILCRDEDAGYLKVQVRRDRDPWKTPDYWPEYAPSVLKYVDLAGLPAGSYYQMARFLEILYRSNGHKLGNGWASVIRIMTYDDWMDTFRLLEYGKTREYYEEA